MRPRARRLAAIALAGAVAVVGCGGRPRTASNSPPLALTLPALDGGELDLARFRGQVVVVHVFTTWSIAAQLDVEQLVAADADDQVVVIGVALDPDGRVLVAPWRAAAEVGYVIGLADEAWRAGRGPLGAVPVVPTTVVVDGGGRVVHRVERQLRPGELAALVRSARS